jgi:hypothetical protein
VQLSYDAAFRITQATDALNRGRGDVFRKHRGQPVASSVLMAPISQVFIAAIEAFVAKHRVPLITFERGQRKDDMMVAHLARITGNEGVRFVGKAQEKATVFRTEKRRNLRTGQPYPWLVRCKAHGIDPWAYLRDVLARTPTHPYRRRAELLPQPWSRPDDPRVAGAGGTLPSATRPGDERQQEARREA